MHNTTHDGPALRGFSSDVGFTEAGHRCVMDPQCAAVVQSEFGRHDHVLRYVMHGAGSTAAKEGAVTILRTANKCTPPSPPPSPPPPQQPPAAPPSPPPPVSALCVAGYWPLFATQAEAEAVAPGLSTGRRLSEAVAISVSGGGFTSPYYTFSPSLPSHFEPGDTYVFTASGISASHPFRIGTSRGVIPAWVTGTTTGLTGSGGSVTVAVPPPATRATSCSTATTTRA